MVKEFVTRHRLLLMLPVLLFCFLLASPAEASAEEFPEFSMEYDGIKYEHYVMLQYNNYLCLYNGSCVVQNDGKCVLLVKPVIFKLSGDGWIFADNYSAGVWIATGKGILFSDVDLYYENGSLAFEKKTVRPPLETVLKAETAQELPTTLGSLAKTVVSSAGLLILCIMLSTALVPRLLRLFL